MEEFRCQGCGMQYQTAHGTPFLGDYEAADMLGLIEISAQVSLTPHAPEVVERVDALCAGYHAAPDRAAFIEANPEAGAWWFSARYYEWLTMDRLVTGIDLAGCRLLDVGAGMGFDSYRLALRGAEVTALEFNPVAAEAGRKGFPGLRWIGGFSHMLPFSNASFDAVFFNAAMHHMRDIPAAVSEALRVLRPGGWMITIGDQFRGDDQPIAFEYEFFDKDKSVLLGINEQLPPFTNFVSMLEENRDCVDVEITTNWLHDHAGAPSVLEPTQWDLARDGERLRHSHGSMAMRIRLLKPWPHGRRMQTAGVLAPATFSTWLTEQSEAVTRLAAIIPAEHVDLPFPGEQTKISLLNGWRLPSRGSSIRTGYQRARWILTRRQADRMSFSLRSPDATSFTILVNNRSVLRLEVGKDWRPVAVDLSALDPTAPFVVEIRRDETTEDFDAACFEVRNRRFHKGRQARFLPLAWTGEPR